MPKRVFTEAQKEANRKRTKQWRVAAKEKGPEYEGEVEESDIIMTVRALRCWKPLPGQSRGKDVVDRLFSSIGVDL